MNPQRLLDQFLGPQTSAAAGDTLRSATSALSQPGAKVALGGLAAGGLLGVLLGSKKARKTIGNLAGGVAAYGGAAALGVFAHRAYQKWQDQKSKSTFVGPAHHAPDEGNSTLAASPAPAESRGMSSTAMAGDGRPIELALVRAMISAANADGHICDEERQTIYSHMFSMRLDAEDKAFVLDTLMNPSTPGEIAELANGPEQAAEIYLASRIVMDPDDPLERAYLDDLARQLVLPHDLVQELEIQLRGKNFMAA